MRPVALPVAAALCIVTIGVMALHAAAAGTPTFVQQVAAHAPGVSKLAVTMPAGVTSGNRLVVEVGIWNNSAATASSVTDSAGDTFTELLHLQASDGTELSVWSTPITASTGTLPTITATPTSAADVGVAALEYSGLSAAPGTAAIDQESQQSGSTTSATSGPTAATAASNELAIGFYNDSGFGATLVAGSGFTSRTNVSPTSDMEFVVEDALVGQGATPNAGVTTTAGALWQMATLVFKGGVSAPPTAPGAPTGVTASAGNATATVTWSAPPNGGSVITSYSITPYANGTAQSSSTITGNPPTTSATITGLTNGTSYTFTVTATNSVGTGPASQPSNAVLPGTTNGQPTIDPSTPAIKVVSNNVTSITSDAFSPPSGAVIYAVFSMDSEPSITNPIVASVGNTGSSLAWHLTNRENHTGPGVGGFVEVWWAYNGANQSGITVTGNFAQPSKNVTPPVGALQVLVVTSAAADQTAAATVATYDSAGGSLPSASLTTTRSNSLVLGVANNWDSAVSPTVPSDQTTTINGQTAVVLNSVDQDTYWVQLSKTQPAKGQVVTINDTTPSVRYHMIAWEILGATGQGDWPTVDHDLARSGIATDETSVGTGNVGALVQSWSTKLDGKVTAQPLFLRGVQVSGSTHDVVVAATNQNSLYALDAGTGAVLWRHQLVAPTPNCSIPGGLGITGTPVVDRSTGRIYAVTDDGALRTVSLADGTEVATALQLISSPATNNVWGGLSLINGNVYFVTGSNGCDQNPWQGGIFEVSVAGGSPQLLAHWITVPSLPASTAGGGIWGYGGVSFDAGNGHIYAASADDATGTSGKEGYTPYAGSLLALTSGLTLLGWYQPPQPPNYNCGSPPPCDQDFAATPLVFRPSGCPTMLAAGNKNGDLYVTSEPNLEANNGVDGSHVQSIPLNISIDDLGLGGLYGTPVYSPTTNLVYVTDTGPGISGVAAGLVALAVQPDCSLKVAWSRSVGGAVSNSPNSTPTLANGVVYVGVNDGSVRAFDAATGNQLWSSSSSGFAIYAAPIVANGRVIAGSWDGASAADAGTIRSWTPSSAALGVNPTSLSFSATAGGSNPSSQTVALSNQGVGSLSFSASSDSAWLGVSPTSGSVPNTLTVQPAISGLAAGTYSGNITVTPSVGAAQKVSVSLTVNQAATVPGAPSGVTATGGDRSAIVSWTAPANGGSTITSYTVTPYVGGVAQAVTPVTGNPPATTVTVIGLTNGTSYTFTVSATNAVGTGPNSTPSSPVTPTAASSPVVDVKVTVNATGTTATSPSFSTAQAGETLVAFVSSDGPATAGTQTTSVSGAGLTWSLVGRANGEFGSAEVWTATAAAKLTSVTVSSSETQGGYHQMLTVIAFRSSSGVGTFKAAAASSGAPSASIVTTKAGSLVYGVGVDWDNAVARTVGSGQVIVNQWVDSGTGTTFWVQDQMSAAGAAGSNVVINDTAPTGDQWELVAVEIKAA